MEAAKKEIDSSWFQIRHYLFWGAKELEKTSQPLHFWFKQAAKACDDDDQLHLGLMFITD